MSRVDQYTKWKAYLETEGLDQWIDFGQHIDDAMGVFDAVSGGRRRPFLPEPADLARLHQIVRQRKCFTVLEFGVGHSTIVIADALRKNQNDWERLREKSAIRNRFMFQLFSVDASKDWLERTKKQIPAALANRVHLHYSEVAIGTFNGQLCHYYQNLPDLIPDFIYLDGPFAKDVKGTMHGLSFQCDERTVMSGDLLLMEPTFLPGMFILIDGRTNNARFLARNFKREYAIVWDREGDNTTLELVEERLRKSNVLGSDFFEKDPRH